MLQYILRLSDAKSQSSFHLQNHLRPRAFTRGTGEKLSTPFGAGDTSSTSGQESRPQLLAVISCCRAGPPVPRVCPYPRKNTFARPVESGIQPLVAITRPLNPRKRRTGQVIHKLTRYGVAEAAVKLTVYLNNLSVNAAACQRGLGCLGLTVTCSGGFFNGFLLRQTFSD